MRKNDAETVRFQLDPANLPPLTKAQKAELDALEAMPDSSIDYSDAPALLAIADRAAAHVKRPYADHAALLYDDKGLPK